VSVSFRVVLSRFGRCLETADPPSKESYQLKKVRKVGIKILQKGQSSSWDFVPM
jgi:hypothetical protein